MKTENRKSDNRRGSALILVVVVTVLLAVVVVNALGYLAGWSAARLFRFDRRHQLALAIEIGMQNAGLGVALALTLFLPITVSILGNLDWGPVVGGYLAAILLAGAYAVIGLFVSSRTAVPKRRSMSFIGARPLRKPGRAVVVASVPSESWIFSAIRPCSTGWSGPSPPTPSISPPRSPGRSCSVSYASPGSIAAPITEQPGHLSTKAWAAAMCLDHI